MTFLRFRTHVVGLALVFAGSSAITVPLAGATPNAASVLATSVTAARAEGSVHVVDSGIVNGATVNGSSDSGPAKGTQMISYTEKNLIGHFEVLVVNGATYVKGDSTGLRSFVGFPPLPSAKFSNRWVSVPKSDPNYATFSDDVDFKSLMGDEFTITAPLTFAAQRVVNGMQVVGVRGTINNGTKSVPETIYVQVGGNHLPVMLASGTSPNTSSTTFSRWGEAVHESAPASSTPIDTTGLESP